MPTVGSWKVVCFGFLLAAWVVFPSLEAAAAPGAPTDVVRNFYGVLLDVMQHAAALGPKGRYQKLEPVVRRDVRCAVHGAVVGRPDMEEFDA